MIISDWSVFVRVQRRSGKSLNSIHLACLPACLDTVAVYKFLKSAYICLCFFLDCSISHTLMESPMSIRSGPVTVPVPVPSRLVTTPERNTPNKNHTICDAEQLEKCFPGDCDVVDGFEFVDVLADPSECAEADSDLN